MPQLSDLRSDQALEKPSPTATTFSGEETFVIDERSCCSCAGLVEEKLIRLRQVAMRVLPSRHTLAT